MSRVLLLVPLLSLSCADGGAEHPTGKPVFPTGLAVEPTEGNTLVVVSSNFDLRFDSGAVLAADLQKVREQVEGGDGSVVVSDAYADPVTIPSFGDRPLFDKTGKHVFVTTRGDNQLHELQLDDGELSCGGKKACGVPPFSLQLGANDPFDVVLFPGDEVRGLITHLSSSTAEIFTLDPSVESADRLEVEADAVFFGEDAAGVRNAVVRDATSQVFLTVQQAIDGQIVGSSLTVFAVPGRNRGDDVTTTSVDLTTLTGSINARGLVLVEREGGEGVDVIVALRAPDALARFFFDDVTGTFTLTGLTETCKEPTNLVPAGPRLLLSCQGGEVVQALDPVTLAVQDSVRFLGRNPYGLAVDLVHQQAYVSFFLDDSIGVLDLVDGDGAPRLVARGRIGTQLPPPEDGRE